MHPHPFHPRWLAAACIAVAVAFAPHVWADIELPTVPPPQPVPVLAKTFIGESVDITLSGVSRSGGGLQFIIRRQPSSGTLSEIRMTGANTGVVTYTHNPKFGPGIDQFRYAASAQGIGVSTPAEVTINISERPSVFVAPARLDFHDTPVGRAAFETFELRNNGGGRIKGKLTVPAPWTMVDGDGSYSLGPGETQLLTVSFAPSEARQFTATGSFSHAPDSELGLAGLGFNPVEVVPREIRLEADGHTEVRTGGFLLRNVSDEDHELRIVAPDELVVQDTIHSPAHSELQVALHTRAGFLAALDGKLKLSDSTVALEIPLHVMPAPEHVTVTPEKINFGTLETGRAARTKFTIHNSGGSPADLVVKMPHGIALSPDPGSEKLQPGASREFDIRFSRPLPGKFDEALVIEAGESVASIALSADVRQQWHSPSKGGSSPSSASEIVYNDIPPVMQIRVTRQTRTELDLEWKKTSPAVAKYMLYMRSITFDTKGNPNFRYERLDRVKVRFVREWARATLAGLRPGESVTLCVVGFDADGVPSRPSPPLTIATQPKPVFHIPWLWLCLCALGVLTVLIVRDRRHTRATADAELESRFEGIKS
ncbi:MAG: choice-of-anchor D domain-containing protein [Chthoniobacterales bacterium]